MVRDGIEMYIQHTETDIGSSFKAQSYTAAIKDKLEVSLQLHRPNFARTIKKISKAILNVLAALKRYESRYRERPQ